MPKAITRCFAFIVAVLLSSAYVNAMEVSTGKLKTITDFKSQHIPARNVYVWMPDSYDGKKPHAVLYMHDGQMLFDRTTTWNGQEWGADEVAGKLHKEGKVRDFIIVGVENGGTKLRHAEYFPQKPFESLPKATQKAIYEKNRDPKTPLFGDHIYSDRYLKFLTSELKPYIDKNFAVHTDTQNTFLLGSSMGGLISMYGMLEYPNVFGGAACLSTHWPGTFPDGTHNPMPDAFNNYIKAHLPAAQDHKIYFDYGDKTLDQFYPPLQAKIDQTMWTKGYRYPLWVTNAYPGEPHEETAWNGRLHTPILFLLGK